jgi:hypothetical protein
VREEKGVRERYSGPAFLKTRFLPPGWLLLSWVGIRDSREELKRGERGEGERRERRGLLT